MKKKPKKKRYKKEIIVNCRTNNEMDFMLVLVVLCQHFYRKQIKGKKSITLSKVITEAKKAYTEGQNRLPKNERSKIVWG